MFEGRYTMLASFPKFILIYKNNQKHIPPNPQCMVYVPTFGLLNVGKYTIHWVSRIWIKHSVKTVTCKPKLHPQGVWWTVYSSRVTALIMGVNMYLKESRVTGIFWVDKTYLYLKPQSTLALLIFQVVMTLVDWDRLAVVETVETLSRSISFLDYQRSSLAIGLTTPLFSQQLITGSKILSCWLT